MFHADAKYRHGLDLFNRGRFWDSHEALEEIWKDERCPSRTFYQGLIQLAAAFHHYERGNIRGMHTLLREGGEKLEPYRPLHAGLDLERLLANVGRWRRAIDEVADLPPEGIEIPTLELREPGARA